jgi:branched-chain amino acid transport system ATP-binding protein
MTALLEAHRLSAGYDGQPVVRDLDITLDAGRIVALLGPNGAGKTTTVLTLAGELSPIAGEVRMDGTPAPAGTFRRARRGVSLVTEERSVFMEMNVEENLRVGRCGVEPVLALFPELGPLLKRRVGLLSGGEQQMLALGRALARQPRVLLVDELSLGLAPLLVRRLLDAVRAAADRGVAVLLVEQYIEKALEIADQAYVLERGRVVVQGPAAEVTSQIKEIEMAYLDQRHE